MFGRTDSREHEDTFLADFKKVDARNVVHSPELQHFNLANRRQLLFFCAQSQDPICDRKFGILGQFIWDVFTDEESRDTPAGRLRDEIVDERPGDVAGINVVSNRTEAVDGQECRLMLLDHGRKFGQGGVGAFPHGGTEVRDHDLLID